MSDQAQLDKLRQIIADRGQPNAQVQRPQPTQPPNLVERAKEPFPSAEEE